MWIFMIRFLLLLLATLFVVTSETNVSFDSFFMERILEAKILIFDVFEKLKTDEGAYCWRDMQRIWSGLSNEEDWAFKIFDSFGKIGNGRGFAEGNLIWFGNPSICSKVKAPFFKTHLCSLEVTYDIGTFRYDFCLPETCQEKYVNNLASFLKDLFHLFGMKSVNFYIRSLDIEVTEYGFTAVVFMTFCFVLIGMVIFSTLLHYTLIHKKAKQYKKCKSKEEIINECSISVKTELQLGNLDILEKKENNKNFSMKSILFSFSAINNTKLLIKARNTNNRLQCLDGMRVLALLGVIFGHTHLYFAHFSDNIVRFYEFSNTNPFLWFLFLSLARTVDTFFAISGVLTVYNNKNLKGFQFKRLVLNRFLRLSPTYYFLIFFILEVMLKQNSYLAKGIIDSLSEHCPNQKWLLFFYVNNIFVTQCFGVAWYIANDIQFHIVGLLLIIIMKRSKSAGKTLLVLFVLFSIISTSVILYRYNLYNSEQPSLLIRGIVDKNITYTKPYSRIGSYIIGMACGWLLSKTKCELNISKVKCAFLWATCTNCFYWSVFYLYHFEEGPFISALIFPLRINLWAFAICIFIVLCCSGHGGILNSFFSWDGWYIFSRLSYGAYLIDNLIISNFISKSFRNFHYTHINMIMYFVIMALLIFAVSLLLYLTVEAPAQNIINCLSNRKVKK